MTIRHGKVQEAIEAIIGVDYVFEAKQHDFGVVLSLNNNLDTILDIRDVLPVGWHIEGIGVTQSYEPFVKIDIDK